MGLHHSTGDSQLPSLLIHYVGVKYSELLCNGYPLGMKYYQLNRSVRFREKSDTYFGIRISTMTILRWQEDFQLVNQSTMLPEVRPPLKKHPVFGYYFILLKSLR